MLLIAPKYETMLLINLEAHSTRLLPRGVALPFTSKSILRQKKNYGKTQIFHHAKKIIPNLHFFKSFKRNQNPSRYYYYNSIITNLKFQHKPKLSSFKNPPIKLNLLLLLP